MNLNDVGTIIRVVDSNEKAWTVLHILDEHHVSARTFHKPSKRYPGVEMYAIVSNGKISNEDLAAINRIIDASVVGPQEKHLLE